MKRRAFVRNSTLGLAGGLILPAWISGCKKPLGNFPEGFKIIVVGAGAAGLYAAKKMKEHGAEVQILEASGVIGGRIKKTDDFADYPIDLGAEWIHGQKSLTHSLASDAGVPFYVDNSDSKYLVNGTLQNDYSNADLNQIENLLEGDQNYSGPDMSVLSYAQQIGLDASMYDLLEFITGELGAAASRISIKYTQQEFEDWSSGGTDFKLKTSYFDLLQSTVATHVQDEVVLNAPVAAIDYSGQMVQVTTEGGSVYEADRVLVTVSIPVLKSGSISFSPSLPEEKLTAISAIGMDAGMKVCLKFSTDFWGGNSLIGADKSPVYWSSAYGKDGSTPILTAFVMGEKAEYLSSLGQGVVQELLVELDAVYGGQATSSFVDSLIQDWGQEPYIGGAYSYSTIGIGNSRAILAEAVNSKLFFAGEATNFNGHFQTVQGAMESGEREFEKILCSV
jgi:monoamine oxidase